MKKLNLNWRNYWGILLVLGGVVLVLAMLGTSPRSTRANDNDEERDRGPQVVDRDAVAYGRTYGEWMAAWNQWSYSIPVGNHPLFDNGDCSVGQSGPVWFLGGVFCSSSTGGCSNYTRVRDCNVPSGTALFFPVTDWEDSAVEQEVAENPSNPVQQIGALRALIYSGQRGTEFCQIDHKPIPYLVQRFRVQSAAFGFTLPEDNILTAIYGHDV